MLFAAVHESGSGTSRKWAIEWGTSASFNKTLYKLRWRIENAFNRLKDFRRIATRYDKLARNYLASVCLAAALVWWL
jgi:transposase